MNKVAKGIIIGIFLVIVLWFIANLVIPPLIELSEHQKEAKWIDENFENPIIRSDGTVMESSNPCAYSNAIQDCLRDQAMADERNARIQASNMEIYMSIPQNEDPTIRPADNYWFVQNMEALEEFKEGKNCESIDKFVVYMNDHLTKVETNDSQFKVYNTAIDEYEKASQELCE